VQFSKPVERGKKGSRSSIRTWRYATTSPRLQRVSRREIGRRFGGLNILNYKAMYDAPARSSANSSRRRGRAIWCAACRVASAGGRHRPHAPVHGQDRAYGRTTAAISVRQVAEVLDLIRASRDQGIAIVLISHRMPDCFAVADRVSCYGGPQWRRSHRPSSPEEVTGLITGAIHAA
jgi:simple sugar transport system ATP-binding protein